MTPSIVADVDVQELEKESNALIVKANSYQITTNSAYVEAMEFAKTIKAMQKEIEGAFNPIVQKANAAWKEAIAQKNKRLEPLEKALKFLDAKVRTFRAEQERLRVEEERRVQELALKEAKRLVELQKKAEARGDAAKAEKFAAKADEALSITPTIAPKVSKVEGIVIRKIWKFEIVNANLIPREYLIPNEKMIGAMARDTKGTLQIPGVKIYSEDSSL